MKNLFYVPETLEEIQVLLKEIVDRNDKSVKLDIIYTQVLVQEGINIQLNTEEEA